MKFKMTSFLTLSALAAATLFATTSCKKSNNTPSSGLSATINGTSTPTTGIIGYHSTLYSAVAAFGYHIANGDSTFIVVSFPDSAALNKPLSIIKDAEVEIYDSKGNFDFDSYNLIDHSHGTMTVTTYDKSNKKIAGTFNGVIYNYSDPSGNNFDSVVVANGQFNTTYVEQ